MEIIMNGIKSVLKSWRTRRFTDILKQEFAQPAWAEGE